MNALLVVLSSFGFSWVALHFWHVYLERDGNRLRVQEWLRSDTRGVWVFRFFVLLMILITIFYMFAQGERLGKNMGAVQSGANLSRLP